MRWIDGLLVPRDDDESEALFTVSCCRVVTNYASRLMLVFESFLVSFYSLQTSTLCY